MAVLSVPLLLVVAFSAHGQVNPGWQYTDDKLVTSDPVTMVMPLAPVSTIPNPLSPRYGTPTPLPASKFSGKFVELDDRSDSRLRLNDTRVYLDFNFRQVAPTGAQYDYIYDPTKTIPAMGPWVKSLLQVDTGAYDISDQFVLSSNGDPGSRFYTCANNAAGTTKACTKRKVRRRRYIFGADDRTAIPTSSRTNYPYRTVGIVGNHCTGTLVGPRHVLTAGHCVHSGPGGDWIADLSFRPAYDKDAGVAAAIYGKIPWAKATTTTAWASSGSWNNDYAIIELAYDVGIGWMSFGWHSGINSGWNMNLNGYPGSTLWGKMYHSYGSLLTANSENLQYRNIDMVKGHSGSGVYLYLSSSNFRRIYGVNSCQVWYNNDAKLASDNYIAGHTASSYNQAVRITMSKFSRICGWINSPTIGC